MKVMKASKCMAAVITALMAVCVTFAGCGGSSGGGKAGAETKAAEAAVKKEFGVSGEELIIAGVMAADKLDLEIETTEEELDDFLSLYAMQSDSEKAATLELYQSAISAAFDKKEAAALMNKAKKKMKNIQKDIAEKKATLEKLFKEATAKDTVVKVGDVQMMKTEVTQGLYKAVTGTNPSKFKGNDYRPVECVSWYDAVRFCNLLSEKQGLKPCYSVQGSSNTDKWGTGGKDYRDYDVEVDEKADGWRLPTEAEWEAAANDGYTYSGSNNKDDVAWWQENSDEHPQKVGTKKPNANGLYDMSGNVWEWCWDKEGSNRVYRGGSWYGKYKNSINGWWYIPDDDCFVSKRNWNSADKRYTNVGFRLVRNAN